MADETSILWCDRTFNGWIGCQHVGPECDNCYAEADFDHRKHRAKWGAGQPRSRTAESSWKRPLAWNRAHDKFFAKHGRRQLVFAHSLSDWADNAVPLQWRFDLLDLIRATPNLTWLLLTKRIGNVLELAELSGNWPSNAALGITAGLQATAERDIPKLLRTAAILKPAFTFISVEPMLGPMYLDELELSGGTFNALLGGEIGVSSAVETLPGLDWVIAGGESGRKARPTHPGWLRSLRNQCDRAGTPFMFKQWGAWAPGENVTRRTGTARTATLRNKLWDYGVEDLASEGGHIDYEPDLYRIKASESGRYLDGVHHHALPAALFAANP